MITVPDIKNFLKIEHSEEDSFLTSLLIASTKFIINATHQDVNTGNELFDQAQRLLVTRWYEDRTQVGTAKGLGFLLESLLIQLAYDDSSPSSEAEAAKAYIAENLDALNALSMDQRKVGCIYITTSDDKIWIYDAESNTFVSKSGEVEVVDGGTF